MSLAEAEAASACVLMLALWYVGNNNGYVLPFPPGQVLPPLLARAYALLGELDAGHDTRRRECAAQVKRAHAWVHLAVSVSRVRELERDTVMCRRSRLR